jgi:hypothetical protein
MTETIEKKRISAHRKYLRDIGTRYLSYGQNGLLQIDV